MPILNLYPYNNAQNVDWLVAKVDILHSYAINMGNYSYAINMGNYAVVGVAQRFEGK